MHVAGDKASVSEVQARWAYSELASPRFKHYYQPALTAELTIKVSASVPFNAAEGASTTGPFRHSANAS